MTILGKYQKLRVVLEEVEQEIITQALISIVKLIHMKFIDKILSQKNNDNIMEKMAEREYKL